MLLDRAERAALRAVALDSTLPEVQLALARTRSAQFRFREALDAVNRALALDPNATLTYSLKYEVLTALGRSDEATQAARRGVELDGLSALAVNNLAVSLWSAGMLDSAIRYTDRAVSSTPTEKQWKRTQATIYATAGRLREAVPMCEAYMGTNNQCAGTLAAVAGTTADRDQALTALGAMGRLPGAAAIPTLAAVGTPGNGGFRVFAASPCGGGHAR